MEHRLEHDVGWEMVAGLALISHGGLFGSKNTEFIYIEFGIRLFKKWTDQLYELEIKVILQRLFCLICFRIHCYLAFFFLSKMKLCN